QQRDFRDGIGSVLPRQTRGLPSGCQSQYALISGKIGLPGSRCASVMSTCVEESADAVLGTKRAAVRGLRPPRAWAGDRRGASFAALCLGWPYPPELHHVFSGEASSPFS